MSRNKHSETGVPTKGATRRDVLKWSAATGGLMLAGPLLRAYAQRMGMPKDLEPEMVFACNGGNTQRQFEKHFIPEWSKRAGTKITYLAGQPTNNVAKVRAQKNSPSVDALWLAGAVTYKAIREELVQTLDRSRIPSMALIPPDVANQTRAAPVGVTVCGIVYNKKIFKEKGWAPPSSWWDMWDPKFKGHVGSYSINTTASLSWIAKISTLLTGQYKENLDAFFAKAKELRPNMLDFYTSAGAWETGLQQGNAWMGMNTAVRAKQLIDAGLPLGFVEPKEGFTAYPTWCGVVTNCRSPRAAHAWIEFLVSTEGQEKIAQYIGYVPVNPEAKLPTGPSQNEFFPNIRKVFVPDFANLSGRLTNIVERWNREVER